MPDWTRLAAEQFCYLTTTGRVSGKPRRIEIWFALADRTVYMLSGGHDRSDWVKNLRRLPTVTVEIAGTRFAGRARMVASSAEDELARSLVHGKYAPAHGGLARWRRLALPIAIDLIEETPDSRALQA